MSAGIHVMCLYALIFDTIFKDTHTHTCPYISEYWMKARCCARVHPLLATAVFLRVMRRYFSSSIDIVFLFHRYCCCSVLFIPVFLSLCHCCYWCYSFKHLRWRAHPWKMFIVYECIYYKYWNRVKWQTKNVYWIQ